MAAHPNDVRLVFRNLPLSDLHPNAAIAARAGVCADRQQRFWPLHDAMFADQTALAASALKATAARLGLDAEQFSRCLEDAGATDRVIATDAEDAAELGLDSTPYFFVNGRPQRGLMTREQLEAMVSAEIKATELARR
jgi:protein-disulfide isomerase